VWLIVYTHVVIDCTCKTVCFAVALRTSFLSQPYSYGLQTLSDCTIHTIHGFKVFATCILVFTAYSTSYYSYSKVDIRIPHMSRADCRNSRTSYFILNLNCHVLYLITYRHFTKLVFKSIILIFLSLLKSSYNL
jgi:hypothetical protein